MPSNNESVDFAPEAMPDLQDFFGGDWSFAHNATFSDLPDTHVPTLSVSGDGGPPAEKTEQRLPPPRSPTTKVKPPNLYEALRRSQVLPQQMMMMSPLAGYADGGFFGGAGAGLDLNALDAMGANGGAGLIPTSPTLIMDPTGMMRMKRARVSPYLGAVEPTAFVPGFAGVGGMGMFPVGLGRMRAAKVPLSPIPKGERPQDAKSEVLPAKTMPLVLPFSAGPKAPKPAPAPVKLMPAPAEGPKQQAGPEPLPALEGNIEKNLLSFLGETRNLEYDNITVVELKRILRQYELNATGKKNELIARIQKIRKSYQHLEPDSVNSVKELKMESKKREESSPDTMGSDNGLAGTTPSATVTDLDSLFAGALELPSDEFVFH